MNKKFYYIIPGLFLYITLLIGFYYNEDFTIGASYDFQIHLLTLNEFIKDFKYTFLNYGTMSIGSCDTPPCNTHTPIFIFYLQTINFYGTDVMRFVNMHICLLLPFFFYISLKSKYKLPKKNHLFFYFSLFFLISPYFRALSIWPGSENISILFLIISIYFYINFKNSNLETEKINYLILNILFLAICCYFRPLYCFFSIFFFYEMVLKEKKISFFVIYIFVSFILSFPAFYYIFIMKVDFFTGWMENNFNFFNSAGLGYTMLFFYLLPFIIIEKKIILQIDKKKIIFNSILFIFILYFFNYSMYQGGGIFYHFSQLLFNNNIIFYFILLISIFYFNQLVNIFNLSNIILILILIVLEIDHYFYQETYDPLLLICLPLLFNSKIIENFFKKINLKKINLFFIYCLSFYLILVFRSEIYLLRNIIFNF